MKRFFLNILFFIVLSSTVFAQSSVQDSLSKEVVLTIQQQGESEDFPVDNYSFSFSKEDTYRVGGQAIRGILMVNLEKYSPFLLQAVKGDSTNVVNVQLVAYDPEGKQTNCIQMNHALIRDTALSYQKGYGTNLSVDFIAPDVVVDEVEL